MLLYAPFDCRLLSIIVYGVWVAVSDRFNLVSSGENNKDEESSIFFKEGFICVKFEFECPVLLLKW